MLDNRPKKTTLQGRISQIIRDNCRSKKDFAERIEISADTVKTWDDAHFPKGDTLEKIHRVFGVDINWLLTGRGEPYLKGGITAAEDEGLYGVTEEKTVEGVSHIITSYGPKQVPDAGVGRLVELLLDILKSPEPSLIQAIISNLYAFNAAAEKEKEMERLKERCLALEKKYNQLFDILSKFAKEPEQERRGMMKEIYQVVDGNHLLKRR